MSLRFVGVDDADPRLPTAVIEASLGTTADDLAPGSTLADANAYTAAQVGAVTPASIGAASAADLDNVFGIAIGAVQKTGDTMVGHLVLPGDPTTEFQAVTKGYVDAHAGSGGMTEGEADARYVNLTGDTMTGDLTITGDLLLEFSAAYISGLDVGQLTTPNPVWIGEPTNAAHAATKKYVDDNIVSGGITQAAADTRYVNVTGDTLTGLLIGSGADFAARQTTTSDERGFRIQTSAAAGIAALTHDRTTMKLRNTLAGSPLEISVSTSTKISLITNAVERLKVEDAAITTTVPVVLPANPTANLQAATKQYVDGFTGVTTGTITPTASWTLTSGFLSSLIKVGNLVVLNVTIRNGTGSVSGANPQVATVPAGFRPASLARCAAIVGTGAGGAQVGTTGNVQIVHAGVAISNDCAFSITYEAVN